MKFIGDFGKRNFSRVCVQKIVERANMKSAIIFYAFKKFFCKEEVNGAEAREENRVKSGIF